MEKYKPTARLKKVFSIVWPKLKSALLLTVATLLMWYGVERMQREALEHSYKENTKWIATKH